MQTNNIMIDDYPLDGYNRTDFGIRIIIALMMLKEKTVRIEDVAKIISKGLKEKKIKYNLYNVDLSESDRSLCDWRNEIKEKKRRLYLSLSLKVDMLRV